MLKGVTVAAAKGDVIALLGAGSVSTFLRCINLLETPNAGKIVVAGEQLKLRPGRHSTEPEDRRQVQHPRQASMVFQSFNLWSHMTILENVIEAPVHVLKVPRKRAIEEGACSPRSASSSSAMPTPAHISSGQQQRAAIARALAMEPTWLMLFDEPTSALDPELVGGAEGDARPCRRGPPCS
ncbi:MAG: ATP-binding cassette domain-containing protein [Geminicoccaceae bacterium]